MPPENHELATLDRAFQLLATTENVEEVRSIRDKAEAVRTYVKAAAMGLEAENRAAELKLRAERKAGAMLASLGLKGGDRKSSERDDRLKLSDLGISQSQSKRWQKEAQVSDEAFEEYLHRCREIGKTITAAALLRMADQRSQSRSTAPRRNEPSSTPTFSFSPSSRQAVEMRHTLEDLEGHINLLNQMLRPYGEGRTASLEKGERRAVLYYLHEVQQLFGKIRTCCEAPENPTIDAVSVLRRDRA